MRFRFFAEKELQGFNREAQATVESWQAHWFARKLPARVSLVVSPTADVHLPTNLAWYRLDGEATLHIGASPDTCSFFCGALLAADSANGMPAAEHGLPELAVWLLSEAAHDLAGRLTPGLLPPLAESPVPDGSAPARFSLPYNGELCLCLCCESHPELSLYVTMSAQQSEIWAQRLSEPKPLKPRPALTPRMRAVEPALIKLHVDLAGEALSISDLQDLHPGDVVSLKRSIHQPLAIETDNGQVLGSCYLGRLQANRGVKLVKTVEEKRNG